MTEHDDRRQAALDLVDGNPWWLVHADTCAIQREVGDCSCGLAKLRDDWDAKQLPST